MEAKQSVDDQLVFRFINSDNCKEYLDLWTFLLENELPIRERWVFYLLGKIGFFTDEKMSEIQTEEGIRSGADFYSEVFYWAEFLKKESEILVEIEKELIAAGYTDARPPHHPPVSCIKSMLRSKGSKYVWKCRGFEDEPDPKSEEGENTVELNEENDFIDENQFQRNEEQEEQKFWDSIYDDSGW